jgi:hypothetical protein
MAAVVRKLSKSLPDLDWYRRKLAMDPSTLGLAIVPPILAIIVERFNPVTPRLLHRDAKEDFTAYKGNFDEPGNFNKFVEDVQCFTSGAVEASGLAPTVVSVISSGFAVIHEASYPFLLSVVYILPYMGLIIYMLCLLSGVSFLKMYTTAPAQSFLFGKNMNYSECIARVIYGANGILILLAFVVYGFEKIPCLPFVSISHARNPLVVHIPPGG